MASKRKEVLKLPVTLELGEDGYIIAECPAIPGCVSQGRSREEALENIKDAILACLEVRKQRGMPLTVETHEKELDRGLLRSLIRKAGLTVAEFVQFLK